MYHNDLKQLSTGTRVQLILPNLTNKKFDLVSNKFQIKQFKNLFNKDICSFLQLAPFCGQR